ncbi:putative transposase, MuDR, plant [Helianthus debilis subsp. tardiflorus]
MCDIQNITRISYRMSSFTDPIDIMNVNDVFFFNLAESKPFELFQLYVIQEPGVESSDCAFLNNFKIPDLNLSFDESDKKIYENCTQLYLPSNSQGISSIVFEPDHIINSKEEMKLELGKKCLIERFEFKVDRSSKTRYEVSCSVDGCEWRFRAYGFAGDSAFYVKYFNDKHTCSKTLTHQHFRQANPQVVGHYLVPQLKDGSRIYRGNEIKSDFNKI